MRIHRVNWQLWAGFLLSIVAFLSYPTVFVQWPMTRDLPWANILLFVLALVLLFFGLRRAFGPERGMISRVGAVLLGLVSLASLGAFILVAFVAATWLPKSEAAPKVGARAPEFTLPDTRGGKLSLAELRAGDSTRGVLLVFYRGYW